MERKTITLKLETWKKLRAYQLQKINEGEGESVSISDLVAELVNEKL